MLSRWGRWGCPPRPTPRATHRSTIQGRRSPCRRRNSTAPSTARAVTRARRSRPSCWSTAPGRIPTNNFSWNWVPALDALGIPWCTVALPGNGMDDIQVGGEYVVNAIRSMRQRAGRPISIVGHSQGGMIPRWALRFWPDTRPMVDDVIGLAPSNHGTETAQLTCVPDCAPVGLAAERRLGVHQGPQLRPGDLRRHLLHPGLHPHRPVVTPNLDDTGSSSLHGGRRRNHQRRDPGHLPDRRQRAPRDRHLDNVAYALAIDALDNPGPPTPRGSTRSPSAPSPSTPGVDPATAVAGPGRGGRIPRPDDRHLPARPRRARACLLRDRELPGCARFARRGAGQGHERQEQEERRRSARRKSAGARI